MFENFNESLTNDIVNFEQLVPRCVRLRSSHLTGIFMRRFWGRLPDPFPIEKMCKISQFSGSKSQNMKL